jgi:hypothetical protein
VRVFALFGRPTVLMRFHGWATVAWLIMAPVSVLTGLRSSVPYLVGLSVYAAVTGHWSSWQAARTEVAQESMIEQATDASSEG